MGDCLPPVIRGIRKENKTYCTPTLGMAWRAESRSKVVTFTTIYTWHKHENMWNHEPDRLSRCMWIITLRTKVLKYKRSKKYAPNVAFVT